MEHRIEKNDDGVSPVIAVILMVAITVVLAAVDEISSTLSFSNSLFSKHINFPEFFRNIF